MGNCFGSNKVSSQYLEQEGLQPSRASKETKAGTVQNESSFTAINDQPRSAKAPAKTKKVVRFELHEEDSSGKAVTQKDGHNVRITVVVTRQELKQILDLKDKPHQSSLKQLLSSVKLRSEIGNVSEGEDFFDKGMANHWKPALESIPEDSQTMIGALTLD